MNDLRYRLCGAGFALLGLMVVSSNAALAQPRQWGQDRTIEQISPHVFRWGSDNQFGAYVLTDAGIVLIDGHYCQSNTVAWLKEQLALRHDVPVKYVILSHDHQDHICHTQLFSDTATTVGHKNILPHILREHRDSAVPDVTFEQAMDIRLGGVEVKLYYFGASHSDNLIHVHIPADRVLISIDTARNSLFPDLRDFDVHSGLKVYEQLAKLDDVGIVVPGHGGLLTQDVFMRMHDFIESLHDEVLGHMIAGRTLPEIRQLVTMREYSDLGGLDRSLDTNVVTMYDFLYRYREPNRRIEPEEAVACIEESSDCRTAD
jgi:glyoxylase-like metal-dependent hydrolase (beta-lactamase superfamily II)